MNPLTIIATFYLICDIVSIVGNSIMIILFFKERTFSSPCHYLITMRCAADMLHLVGQFVFSYQVFTETTCSQELCYWLLFPTSVGKCMSNPLIFELGIDSYIACKWPVIYRKLLEMPKTYITIQLIFPITYTSILMVSGFFEKTAELQVVCTAPQAFLGTAFYNFNTSGAVINVAIVILYFFTYIKIRKLANTSQIKIVFRSIFWTVVLVVVGSSSVTITNQFTRLVGDPATRRLISIYTGIGVNVACASNVFVFYLINTEYRLAIRQLFGMAPVHPINHSVIPSSRIRNTMFHEM